MSKEIYVWACDYSLKTGEGEVAEFTQVQKEIFDFAVFEQPLSGLISSGDPPTTDPKDPIDENPVDLGDIGQDDVEPPTILN